MSGDRLGLPLLLGRRTTLSALAAVTLGLLPAAERAGTAALDRSQDESATAYPSLAETATTDQPREFHETVPFTPLPEESASAGTRSLNGTWSFTLAGHALRPGIKRRTIPDRSPAGNDGVLVNGPTLVASPTGQAVDLGEDRYVAVGGVDVTDPGVTIQVRFRYSGDTVLFSKGNTQYAAGVYDDQVVFWTKGGGDWPTISGGDLAPGEWHTATCVVDEAELRLSVDGRQVATKPHDATALPSTDGPLHLGYNAVSGTQGDPVLDALVAFDRPLSADEVGSADGLPRGEAIVDLTFETIEDGDFAWRPEPVPGQWGYDESVLDSRSAWASTPGIDGWYRRTFGIPDGWSGRRVVLRFEAVYSRARVFVDGERVATHVGGYTPFEVDVTDHVTPGGEHALVVGVEQRSASDDMAWGNVTGGITRDVTLASVPDCHLGELFVRTELHDDGDSATVTAETTVSNDDEEAVEGATLSAELRGADGVVVGTAEERLDIGAGGQADRELSIAVDDPATWNPEQPRLYTLDCTLRTDGAVERVTERVGIREIEVEGTDLRLNGQSVTLRGVNWEEIHLPEHGQAVPPARTRADAALLRAANINYVRTAHHPPSRAFVEACDELGIVLEVEAPHMFVGRQGSDPRPATIRRQTAEMVARDRNRPSVGWWSIANESAWDPSFAAAERIASNLDPTRPTIFNYHTYQAGHPWQDQFDLAADHYPGISTGSTIEATDRAVDRPVVFGEYAHTYCYGDRELVTDPGLRDEWGRLFEALWEQSRDATTVAGVAIWAGGDHATAWGEFRWGLLDRYRRKRPEYWHVKKAYSPVRITGAGWSDEGSQVELTVENRHEFVNLRERTVAWESGPERGEREVDLAPGETGTVSVPVPGETVTVTVSHPQGFTVDTVRLSPASPAPESLEQADSVSTSTSSSAVELRTSGAWLRVDRDSGHATIGPAGGLPVTVGGPDLVLTPLQTDTGREYVRSIEHRPAGRSVTDVRSVDDGTAIAIDIEYDVATCTIELRPREGGFEIEYEATLDASLAVREAGITLQTTGAHRTLSWVRDGQWRAYPDDHVGRLAGTASAFPSGTRPETARLTTESGQPWRVDATSHGSNDFRSTKRSIYVAELAADDDRGLRIRSDGETHVRAQVRDGGVDLLALDRSVSGAGPDWIDRHAAMGQRKRVAAGERITGTVTVEVLGGDGQPAIGGATGPPGTVDGDAALEDVTGDGRAGLDDVTTYLRNRRSETIWGHPELFDFDGDGTSGEVDDALALLREVVDRR